MARRGWGSEEARRLLADSELGSAAALLREHGHGWSSSAVRALLAALPGRRGRPRKLGDAELKQARGLVESGLSLAEVANRLGRPKSTVWGALQRDPE